MLLNRYLKVIADNALSITVFLQNNTKLNGLIAVFDEQSLVLQDKISNQQVISFSGITSIALKNTANDEVKKFFINELNLDSFSTMNTFTQNIQDLSLKHRFFNLAKDAIENQGRSLEVVNYSIQGHAFRGKPIMTDHKIQLILNSLNVPQIVFWNAVATTCCVPILKSKSAKL